MSQWWPLLPEFIYFASKGILRKQKLRPEQFTFNSHFNISQKDLEQWQKIFSSQQANTCFLYHWPQFMRFFLRTMNVTGLALKNIRHLAQNIENHQPKNQLKPGTYSVESKIITFYKRRAGQLMCVTQSELKTLAGEKILTSLDYSIILNVDDNNFRNIEAQLEVMPEELNQRFLNLKNKAPTINEQNSRKESIRLPANAGVKYGLVCGDMNPMHGYKSIAKLIGIKAPFIQGTWITNFVLQQLLQNKAIKQLNVTFCNPLYMEKDYELIIGKDHFEIVRQNRLAAFGNYKPAS